MSHWLGARMFIYVGGPLSLPHSQLPGSGGLPVMAQGAEHCLSLLPTIDSHPLPGACHFLIQKDSLIRYIRYLACFSSKIIENGIKMFSRQFVTQHIETWRSFNFRTRCARKNPHKCNQKKLKNEILSVSQFCWLKIVFQRQWVYGNITTTSPLYIHPIKNIHFRARFCAILILKNCLFYVFSHNTRPSLRAHMRRGILIFARWPEVYVYQIWRSNSLPVRNYRPKTVFLCDVIEGVTWPPWPWKSSCRISM